MSAAKKEQIYVELRKYHLNEFPDSYTDPVINDLLQEYRILEDQAVSMLLGLVNGKTEYTDLTREFLAFEAKIKLASEQSQTKDLSLFKTKLNNLEQIIHLAKSASFVMRPVRHIRQSTRAVETKVNKK